MVNYVDFPEAIPKNEFLYTVAGAEPTNKLPFHTMFALQPANAAHDVI